MARIVNDEKPDAIAFENLKRNDKLVQEKAAARGQLTFTLVEQDASAHEVILEWIKLNLRTAPIPKLRDAFEHCLAFATSTIPKKLAD